jgi:hypothetical protein
LTTVADLCALSAKTRVVVVRARLIGRCVAPEVVIAIEVRIVVNIIFVMTVFHSSSSPSKI